MTESVVRNGLFITGTDTGVGKTHVTCLIARQLIRQGISVAAYKPVCSGGIVRSTSTGCSATATDYYWEDLERIKAVVGPGWSDELICPQRFLAPLAPPVAARLEGRTVDFQQLVDGIQSFAAQEMLIVEGAGGWLSPVTETQTVADLATALRFPVIIVARASLGTINHTLLTIQSIRAKRLPLAGVVLNQVTLPGDDQSYMTNQEEIESRSGVPVFGIIAFDSDDQIVCHGRPVTINWRLLAGKPSDQP